jgi:uncharacterized cupredoxin-like copper-binding protein
LIYTAKGAKSTAHKSARVTTNDTTLGKVTISFKADITEPDDSLMKLTANPPILDFGAPGEKIIRKLQSKIKNTSEEEIELEIVSVTPNFFEEVKLSRSELKPGKEAKLEIELKKDQEEEKFQKSITLEAKFKDKKKERLTIPLIKGVGESATAKKDKK